MTDNHYDVIVIGAGPSGATVSNILASAGKKVVVLEKDHFPRFHIGESLLPATVGIFERLGAHDAIREAFIRKPGGKWLYGDTAVDGDFGNHQPFAIFKDHPYAYLVERSTFDQILADRAAEAGAEVRFGVEVTDLLQGDERMEGVRIKDEDGGEHELRADLVVDASGLQGVIANRLRLRSLDEPRRMGIYAQYKARPGREDLEAGWFVSQMLYNSWVWLLQLPRDRFSVGIVLEQEHFRRMKCKPRELLDHLVRTNNFFQEGLVDPELEGEVHVTGNMGCDSSAYRGPGWVMVGDAAFFVDPCYSSGVHLAMESAEIVADTILGAGGSCRLEPAAFDAYEEKLRVHRANVIRMVDSFYIASRNTSVQKMVTSMQGGLLTRRFVSFVGGDFSNTPFYTRIHLIHRFVAWMFGNDPKRAPRNRPDFLCPLPRDEAATPGPALEAPGEAADPSPA